MANDGSFRTRGVSARRRLYAAGPADLITHHIHAPGVGLPLSGEHQGGCSRAPAPAQGEGGGNAWERFRRWFSGEF